jgi:hypothetical protein
VLTDIIFTENDTSYIHNNTICGKIKYQVVIYDLITGQEKIFDENEDFLHKEVTDEMIYEQYFDLIQGAKIAYPNVEKYDMLCALIVFHIIVLSILQLNSIIEQILKIAELITFIARSL